MKIYESLSAGTPVVSTSFQPYLGKKFSGLIEICESYEEFVAMVNMFVETSPSRDWQEKAWIFVLENTWQARVQQV